MRRQWKRFWLRFQYAFREPYDVEANRRLVAEIEALG